MKFLRSLPNAVVLRIYLIKQEQTPLALSDLVHDLQTLRTPLPAKRHHRVRCDRNRSDVCELLLGVGREPSDELVIDVRPDLELMLPLLYRYARGAQNEAALLDGAARRDTDQRLAGAARKHNDAASCATKSVSSEHDNSHQTHSINTEN